MIQWIRRHNGAVETLTLYRVLVEIDELLVIEMREGLPGENGDVVGIYDLEGDLLDVTSEWEIVEAADAATLEQLEDAWTTGLTTMERVRCVAPRTGNTA